MAKFDDVDDDIEATLLGLRETVFTVVVCYILDQPGESQDAEHLFAKNLGKKTYTFTNCPNAEQAGHAGEAEVSEFCERHYGKAPWAVWTAAIFIGRPEEARVPAFERIGEV